MKTYYSNILVSQEYFWIVDQGEGGWKWVRVWVALRKSIMDFVKRVELNATVCPAAVQGASACKYSFTPSLEYCPV
jgi:hypothetical protein